MTDLYKKTYRGYLIDHHSPNPPIVTLDKINIEEYEQFFKTAHINNLMLYCKDHWGVTYYDSKVGCRHPGLKEDWIAKLRPVLKRNKIEFNAYYCLEYDNLAPSMHPEWRVLKSDGTPLTCLYSRAMWRMPCYETGYRQYVLTQLQEIISNYHPDSLFLDIFGKSLCYCPHCRQKFERIYGYPLPEKEEELVAHNQDITEFLDNCAQKMLEEIISSLKEIDSELKITINFAALYKKKIRDLLDYQFTEPWAGNWISAAYARDTAVGQYPQLGPGDVSEVYNYRCENIYKLAAAEIAAQGCRVFIYSGSQHPDGTLEHEEARRIGSAYAEIEKFESYLQNRQVLADIGIIQSDLSDTIKADKSIPPNAIARVKIGSAHRLALLGAMKLCDHLKYSWKVIPEGELEKEENKNSHNFKVLLLPEVYFISDKLKNYLTNFVNQGGVVISAGESGLYDCKGNLLANFSISELLGVSLQEIYKKYARSDWGAYLQPIPSLDSSSFGDSIWKYIPPTTPPVGPVRYRVDASTSSKGTSLGPIRESVRPLATFINPATEITEDKWVNWWCPPPSYPTNDWALCEHSMGKGKVLYAAFDFFNMKNKGFHLLDAIFQGILEKYLPNPIIKLQTSYPDILGIVSYIRNSNQKGGAESSIPDDNKWREIIIHQVSHLAATSNGNIPPVDGGILILAENTEQWKKIISARVVYPQESELYLSRDTERQEVRINLPAVNIHQIIHLIVE